jgi:hypothetical protein
MRSKCPACHYHLSEFVRQRRSDGVWLFSEVCARCGWNVRGPGVWVPYSKVPNPDQCRVIDRRAPRGERPDQPTLF